MKGNARAEWFDLYFRMSFYQRIHSCSFLPG
jgi:hypothetical protein